MRSRRSARTCLVRWSTIPTSARSTVPATKDRFRRSTAVRSPAHPRGACPASYSSSSGRISSQLESRCDMETRQQGLTLFSALLVLIATLVVLQLWLIAAALDALLAQHLEVLAPTAVASIVLSLMSG